MLKILKNYIILLSLLFSLIFCTRDTANIPEIPVNLIIHVSDPLFLNLHPIGGYIYHPGGSRGLLIYRKDAEEILAYDRHCPFEPEKTCGQISMDKSNSFLAVDSCCSSKFFLLDGSANQGPAKYPLKRYNSFFDGNKLTIYN